MRPVRTIEIVANGRRYREAVEPRLSLADFLRDRLGLTGTHLGCEQGVCGSCTVLLDGKTVRSCLVLAVQADGRSVTTVEGLAGGPEDPGGLHPVQRAFLEAAAFQCGYCTPGFLLTVDELLRENPAPSEEEIRERLSGNLCRCTGYQHIVDAALRAAARPRPEQNHGGHPAP
ncbi:MAG TPA: (2Fe-2S)-binding protein [candidate division Zixibacteria bacterium]|nr:(2Fe-2S)-binding protein [candidate division Zixibacteria bacterium]